MASLALLGSIQKKISCGISTKPCINFSTSQHGFAFISFPSCHNIKGLCPFFYSPTFNPDQMELFTQTARLHFSTRSTQQLNQLKLYLHDQIALIEGRVKRKKEKGVPHMKKNWMIALQMIEEEINRRE